jgi:arylsulfatase A
VTRFRLAACLLALVCWPSTLRAAPSPNFIIILCDDLGYGDLACYGHPHIRTPHLDRLAAEGIRFTHAYSAAPVCSPARVGLLTGRHPHRAGIFDWIPAAKPGVSENRSLVHLRRAEITLPALLRSAGYHTALAGKWHCNADFNSQRQPQPDAAGFDHWFATQNNAAPSHADPVNFVRNGLPVGKIEGFSCQIVVQEGIRWLEERNHPQQPPQPFFLKIAFHEPHEPVASPADIVGSYQDTARNPKEADYFANVTNLDDAVGKLLAALDRLDLAENTLIFFTSDNGPETLDRYAGAGRSYGSPGQLRGMKLWTTEAGCRVPGILRWPAQVRPGQTLETPVSALDLLPTFCELAGASTPPGHHLDGTSLVPLLHGTPPRRDQPLFWVYYSAINDQRAALRDGPWKLLAKLDHGALPRAMNLTESRAPRYRAARLTDFSLFHLERDPGEADDLAATEPEVLAELVAKLEKLHAGLVADMHVWPEPTD